MKIKLLFLSVFTVCMVQSNAQPILNENFDYGSSPGSVTTLSGGSWVNHSGTAGTLNYLATSLSMTGYGSSGVGGSIDISTSQSEDANRMFTPIGSGNLYYAALLNVSSASATNSGYFMHLGATTDGTTISGTTFNARLFAQDNGSGQFNLGISSTSTPAFGTTNYAYNTTYLVVVRFNVVNGDLALHVLNAVEASEPLTPEVTNSGFGNDTLNTIAVRQSNSTSSGLVAAVVDGIRIADNWDDALGIVGGSATDLAFQNISPNCIEPNTNFSFEVCAIDLAGDVVTTYNDDITVAKTVGSGNLTGTTTATPVDGCATFSGFQLDAADSYQLTATASGLNNGTTNLSIVNNCPDSYDTLKVVAYNMLFFSAGETFCGGTTNVPSRHDTLRKIMDFVNPDVLLGCEIQDATAANNILSSSLNVNGETKYAMANFVLDQSGGSNDLNNAFYYNSNKLTLYAQDEIATDLRDIGVYKCFGNDPNLAIHKDTTFFNFYMAHIKAGSSASDSIQRIGEATELRNYIDAEKAGVNHIMGGDLNVNSSDEGAYQVLTNQGTYPLNDPINQPGNWSDTPWDFADILTQSTRAVGESFDCGAEGGVDDRLDFLLVSDNVMNKSDGVSYVANTYKALGNDGNHYNLSINDGANGVVPDSIANALYYMSDHLPVIMDLAIEYPALQSVLSFTFTETEPSCNGGSDGSISVVVDGGTTPYSYLWNTGNTEANLTGLISAVYTVTVTDGTTVTESASVTLSEPTAIVLSANVVNESSAGASDGQMSVSATGGTPSYTYIWSTGSSVATVTGVTSGSYAVTVSDNNGCNAVESVTVIDQGSCSVSVSATFTEPSCGGLSDGTATAAATSGSSPYSYQWSNGESGAVIGNVSAGPLSVTVTDNQFCTAIASLTVTEPSTIADVAGTGDSAAVCGTEFGVALLDYVTGYSSSDGSWNDVDGAGVLFGSISPAIMSEGVYHFYYVIDNGGTCPNDSTEVTINVVGPPNAGTSHDALGCVMTNAMNLAEGLGNYDAGGVWDDVDLTGHLTDSIFDASAAGEGVYEVHHVVTDPLGVCANDTAVITVNVVDVPDPGTSQSADLCDTEFVVNPFDYLGGTPDAGGSWRDVDNSNAFFFGNFSPATAGEGVFNFTYTVEATGCASDSATVTFNVIGSPNAGFNNNIDACPSVVSQIDLADSLGGNPDVGGTWVDLDGSGLLSGSVVNVVASTISYNFGYVVSGNAPCVNDTSITTVNMGVCNSINNLVNNRTIKIYPNPSDELVTILINGGTNNLVTLQVLNVLGEVVLEDIVDGGKTTLNISSLNPGQYFVKLYMNDQVTVDKILIK